MKNMTGKRMVIPKKEVANFCFNGKRQGNSCDIIFKFKANYFKRN